MSKELVAKIEEIGEETASLVKKAEKKLGEELSEKLEEKGKKIGDDAKKIAEELIAKAIGDLKNEHQEEVTALKDELKTTKEDLKKIKAEAGTKFGPNHGLAETLADVIMKELTKPENKEKIKNLKAMGGNANVNFDLEVPKFFTKAVHTLTSTGDVTGTNPRLLLGSADAGVVPFARRRPFLRQIVNVARTSKRYVQWVEKDNAEGGAGMTAEGAAKSQASLQWATKSIEVKKVTAFIKVATEVLEDIEEAEGDIRAELIEIIELKLDEQMLLGDGTGNNIKGIDAWATAFSAGDLAGDVAEANTMDVIRVGVAVMANNNFSPNVVLMNPVDAATLDLAKASDGHYVAPPFKTADGRQISGVVVIENPGVTAGTMYLMDSSKVKARIRKDMSVSVGFSGTDFTDNVVTILGELRAAQYVASNDANAVVKIVIDTAKAAINQA